MTALYLHHLRAPDRVSVKPHAAPVLHAINYLLGRLDRSYLTRLRAFGGLQSYPSRVKDPDPVDFSTGSVGIGATATIWSALAHRYVAGHFDVPRGGCHVALLGNAELDEGAIWETLVDPMVPRLGEVLWIVDLNRQSLDRVVPDIAAGRIGAMFAAAGWQTITVKYGRRLRELFAREGGEKLRARIDEMPNEEYQRLLRSPVAELRERLPGTGQRRRDMVRLLRELGDDEVHSAIRDLGGHDLADLLSAFREADEATDRPPSSSPTRSRPGTCRPRAIPRTTRRCSPWRNGSTSRPSSAPTRPSRGRRLRPTAGRPRSAGAPRPGWRVVRRRRAVLRRRLRTSRGLTPAPRRRSRHSVASSSISRARRRTSPRTWSGQP